MCVHVFPSCSSIYFLNQPALYLQHAIISTIHHLKTFYGYVPHPCVKAMYTFWAYGEWTFGGGWVRWCGWVSVCGCDALVVWSNWIRYVFVDCTNWPSPTVRGPVHLVDTPHSTASCAVCTMSVHARTHAQTLGVCVCAYNWVCVATLNAPVGLGDTK